MNLPPSDEVRRRGREGGDGALHVGGAAPVDEAVGDVGGKGRMRPSIRMAFGHHVGMPRETQMRAARTETGKEVLDIRCICILEDQALADEARLRQAIFQQGQGAAFVGVTDLQRMSSCSSGTGSVGVFFMEPA